jgi:hypothetical protein
VHRRSAVWLVTIPLALLGCELAQMLGHALLGAPEGPRGELFSGAGPGASLVPPAVALALGVVGVALAGRIAGVWSSARGGCASAVPFAALAPLVLVLQEHVERLLHGGSVATTMAQPRFLPFLLLQLPVAAAGHLAARLLLRLADDLRGRIVRRARVPRAQRTAPRPRARDAGRPARGAAWAHSGRAPPALSPTAG